eukprot:scaffold155245_cov22-Tisochrysis_lutea.AAC.1
MACGDGMWSVVACGHGMRNPCIVEFHLSWWYTELVACAFSKTPGKRVHPWVQFAEVVHGTIEHLLSRRAALCNSVCLDGMHTLQILVQGDGVPKPILTFDEASFPAYVLSEVVRAGFTQPTPIQSQVGFFTRVLKNSQPASNFFQMIL